MGFLKGVLMVPEANSRLIYLLWSMTMNVGFLLVLYKLLGASPAQQPILKEMLFVLAGGHMSGSVGRVLTKLGDGVQNDGGGNQPDAEQPKE